MISVLILTLNEEVNLPACLESVSWSDDVVVLDDSSIDRTVEIAEAWGARVIRHSAGGERSQRSYALREICFKYSWVFNPDADEVTPDELRDEMLTTVADTSRREVAYRVRFKAMFMGRWVKHSSLYPTWVVRLFRPDRISLSRDINLNYKIQGQEGKLSSHFIHNSFNKGLSAWFDKHNRYSDIEAHEALREIDRGCLDWKSVFSFRNPPGRRKALKNLAWRIPGRSICVFLYLFFGRLAFLDGRAGFQYCLLRFLYEYMIDIKIKELRRRERSLPV